MVITKKMTTIDGIPAIIFGVPSRRIYLYIHGKGGNKEEAQSIAEVICRYGYQVLSIDLPEHGERKSEINSFDPWHIVPELTDVMGFVKVHWERVSLFANSIGAWFSMLSFGNECLDDCLFVSPVLDMKPLFWQVLRLAMVQL